MASYLYWLNLLKFKNCPAFNCITPPLVTWNGLLLGSDCELFPPPLPLVRVKDVKVTVSPSLSFVDIVPIVVKLLLFAPKPLSSLLPLSSAQLKTWLAIVGAWLLVTLTINGKVVRYPLALGSELL